MVSPEMSSARSNRPELKLRVGRMPSSLHRPKTAGVPNCVTVLGLGVFQQDASEIFADLTHLFGVIGLCGLRLAVVKHDSLDPLGAHDRPQSAAARQADLDSACSLDGQLPLRTSAFLPPARCTSNRRHPQSARAVYERSH